MESGKYKYLLLQQDSSYYWTRARGMSRYYGERKVLGHAYISLLPNKDFDLPNAVLRKLHLYPAFVVSKIPTLSTIVFPYERYRIGQSSSLHSYKAGVEKGFYHSKDILDAPGALIEFTPQSGSGVNKKFEAPFYVGDGIILNSKGKMIFGVFVRAELVDRSYLRAKKCVVKVAEEVFTNQSAPLSRIILKEILPDIMGEQYVLTMLKGDNNHNIWGLEEGCRKASKMLDVVLEVDKEDVPVERPVAPTPNVTNEDICNRIAAFIEHDIAIASTQ